MYKALSARQAKESEYGDKGYSDYLEAIADEHYRYFMAKGDKKNAERMLTQSLSEALQGNDGI